MKTPALLASVLIPFGISSAPALDFIRQINVIDGASVVTDIPVSAASGEVTSMSLSTSVSIFQLYAAYTKADGIIEILKLDEKTVGTFLPEVSLKVFSEDKHVPTTTRADQPYGVTLTINGLLSGDEIPDYAKSINLKRSYKQYSPLSYAPTGEGGDYPEPRVFNSNGTFTETGVYQQLPDGTPIQAMGSETFSAYLWPEADPSQGQLATAEVIVWPVSDAAIVGIEEGKIYKELPTKGSVTLRNAYPRSTTYAQIYKGVPKLGTNGHLIDSTVRTYGSTAGAPNKPQHSTMPISLQPLDDQLGAEGTYTIEVLTVTPFNGGTPERLAFVSFILDRKIELNATLTTIE